MGEAGAGGGSGESPKERVDRELIELLNELRVSLPGVQVLFAFLLTVPFSAGFGRLTSGQRSWYFATFLATAAASALLMAPTSYHRILFRTVDKERMVRTATRFAIAGTVLLSLAIAGAGMAMVRSPPVAPCAWGMICRSIRLAGGMRNGFTAPEAGIWGAYPRSRGLAHSGRRL